MMKTIIIKLIEFYRNCLSVYKIRSCRFHPTCSHYTQDAVQKYGIMRGLSKGIYRILRCNPLSRGGYDPA